MIIHIKKKNLYALVLLEFLEKNNLTHALKAEANLICLLIGAQELRNFFGIEYSSNLGDILSQFTNRLNKFIPKTFNERPSKEQMEVMSISLSKSDSEDSNKKYCFGFKRNPKGYSRSSFNDNKARLLRPNLYKYFKADNTISFCFSSEIQSEKTDSEIMEVFSKNSTQLK